MGISNRDIEALARARRDHAKSKVLQLRRALVDARFRGDRESVNEIEYQILEYAQVADAPFGMIVQSVRDEYMGR